MARTLKYIISSAYSHRVGRAGGDETSAMPTKQPEYSRQLNDRFGRLCRLLDYVDYSVRHGMDAVRNLCFRRMM